MKILLIHQNFLEPEDGGGSRFNEMSRLWEEAGHEITVLAGMIHHATGHKPERYRGKYTYVDVLSDRRRVIRCHVAAVYAKGFAGRLWGYFSFVFSALYAGLFRAGKGYDVILATSPPLFTGITARLLSILKRVPMVFEVRDLWPESAIDTGVLRNKLVIRWAYALEAYLYRHAVLVSVLTPAFRQILIERKGIAEAKILLLPNAADFSLAERAALGFDRLAFRQKQAWEGKLVFIYVGAHGVANHLMQLIDAAEQLQREEKVLFVLVGDGMQKPALQAEVKRRNLHNVQFVSSVPKSEVFHYILAADYGLSVLKKCETFKTIYSNKTFDYMSCKKPVLLLIDGVSRELIETARCGYYVEPENTEAFVALVHRCLLETEENRRRMGESGYRYAKAHFDREVLARNYIRALEAVLSARMKRC